MDKSQEEKNKLFDRVFSNLQERKERILSGKINCIPWGLPRFEEDSPGIEQGKYYMITGAAKSAKSQIADWLFLLNIIQQIIDNNLNIDFKLFYFTLEISKEEKMLSCFSHILYMRENIRISPVDLKSTRQGKPLSEEVEEAILRCRPYFDLIEEHVEFIDSIRHPFGIYNFMREYALANGKVHYKEININGNLTKIEDYYEANNPDQYVMIMIDHISLITPEKRNGVTLTLHESMGILSADYLIKLRNRFKYIPIVIQQQALAGENLEHKKAGSLKPSAANLGDNKLTIRDVNVAFGIFSPFKYELKEYYGYDISTFRDNIRFLEIIVSRDGGGGSVCPLYFDGAVNVFKELPKPNEREKIEKVKNLIQKIRHE